MPYTLGYAKNRMERVKYIACKLVCVWHMTINSTIYYNKGLLYCCLYIPIYIKYMTLLNCFLSQTLIVIWNNRYSPSKLLMIKQKFGGTDLETMCGYFYYIYTIRWICFYFFYGWIWRIKCRFILVKSKNDLLLICFNFIVLSNIHLLV